MTRTPSIGEAQRKLECALFDHRNIVVYKLGLSAEEQYPVGSAEYHLQAVLEYMREAYVILGQHVITDGELCPYQGCSWSCGFNEQGWYICPHCGRRFYASVRDGDFSDWNLYKAGDENAPPMPQVMPIAHDLGPSWGTPDEDKGVHPNYKDE